MSYRFAVMSDRKGRGEQPRKSRARARAGKNAARKAAAADDVDQPTEDVELKDMSGRNSANTAGVSAIGSVLLSKRTRTPSDKAAANAASGQGDGGEDADDGVSEGRHAVAERRRV